MEIELARNKMKSTQKQTSKGVKIKSKNIYIYIYILYIKFNNFFKNCKPKRKD